MYPDNPKRHRRLLLGGRLAILKQRVRCEQLKYAVVAGAVVGGGLTVIANAPNPAGQSILSRFFANGVSPVGLFLGALVPTVITGAIFVLLR